jgi:hypothetical protein
MTDRVQSITVVPTQNASSSSVCYLWLHLPQQGSGRRSSRLTARTVKAAENVRLAEQTAAEAAEAAAAANAFAGPPGGCLLDACSAAELALIANQARSHCRPHMRTLSAPDGLDAPMLRMGQAQPSHRGSDELGACRCWSCVQRCLRGAAEPSHRTP